MNKNRDMRYFILQQLLLACILYIPVFSFAQYSNFWAFGGNNIMNFNTLAKHTYTTDCSTTNTVGEMPSNYVGTYICDRRGNLLFSLMQDTIFDRNFKPILNGYPITRNCEYHSVVIIPFVGDTNQYYIFSYKDDSTFNDCFSHPQSIGLYYSVVDIRLNNGLGSVTKQNVRILNGQGYASVQTINSYTPFHNTNIVNHSNGKDYWLVTNNDTCIISYLIAASGIDTLHPVKSCVIPMQVTSSTNQYLFGNNGFLKPSHDGKTLILCSTYLRYQNQQLRRGPIKMNFDPTTGIASIPKILSMPFYDTTFAKYGHFGDAFYSVEFSPNDSIMYFSHSMYIYPDSIYDNSIVQALRYSDIPETAYYKLPYSGTNLRNYGALKGTLLLGPDAKLYLFGDGYNGLSVIQNPDIYGYGCNLNCDVWHCTESYGTRNFMPNQPYYPEQVRFLHQQNCKDSIIFFNKSDTLFKTYRWIFNNIDSVDGDSVKYAFAHSGKYLVTLKAFSRYGYMRQLTDTVLFYKKPKAKMYFKDSLGCQWVAFSYKDSSKNDTLNPNQTTLKWLWDFGDGTTDSLQNINHIYTKSGVYNVKLKIDNGFCSDSQTMVNKVNILSAPKPGFTLDKTIECIPPATAFIANDTLTELVTKKTYRFADSLPDNNINITQHTVQYLYTAKGKYNITQTLYSPSGCVSKDSQYVQVFGSLAAFKPSSPNITINNNDMVELWWNKNVDTKNYLLYKATNYTSLSLYKNQSDTFIIDSSAQNIYTSTYQYALQLTDNCGQISPTSDTETSILLTGKNNHNVYGLFNWNNITATTNNFTLKKWRGFDTIYINNISTSPYYDNDFYNDTVQQSSSYQIQTLNNRGYHISSNKTYLGYEPVVIIPTLYDVIVYPNGVPVIAFYIKHFDIEIYDLLGRNVFTGSDIKGWYNGDGGAQYFIYRITGTTKDDKPFNQSGKILLLK